MRIRVQRKDGSIETIHLGKAWIVREGRYLDSAEAIEGVRHFFTKDGYYDGWGAELNSSSTTDAEEQLLAMEEKRIIEPTDD